MQYRHRPAPAKRRVVVWRPYERRLVRHSRRCGGSPASHDVVPYGQFEAMAVSPLASGRLNPPDICLIYTNPAQMIIFINGLQWTGYEKPSFSCVGESACADSWGKALSTGEPSLSIPCFAERRYGGGYGGRTSDGYPSALPYQGNSRTGGPCQQRPALSDSQLRRKQRRSCRRALATSPKAPLPSVVFWHF